MSGSHTYGAPPPYSSMPYSQPLNSSGYSQGPTFTPGVNFAGISRGRQNPYNPRGRGNGRGRGRGRGAQNQQGQQTEKLDPETKFVRDIGPDARESNYVPFTNMRGLGQGEDYLETDYAVFEGLGGPCPWCQLFKPYGPGDLKVHVLLNHLPGRAGVLACRLCDEVFTTEMEVRRHLSARHGRGRWFNEELNGPTAYFSLLNEASEVEKGRMDDPPPPGFGRAARKQVFVNNEVLLRKRLVRYKEKGLPPTVYQPVLPKDDEPRTMELTLKFLAGHINRVLAVLVDDSEQAPGAQVMHQLDTILEEVQARVLQAQWGIEEYKQYKLALLAPMEEDDSALDTDGHPPTQPKGSAAPKGVATTTGQTTPGTANGPPLQNTSHQPAFDPQNQADVNSAAAAAALMAESTSI